MVKLGPGPVVAFDDELALDDELFAKLEANNKKLSFDESMRNRLQDICVNIAVLRKSMNEAPNSGDVIKLLEKTIKETKSLIVTLNKITGDSPASRVIDGRIGPQLYSAGYPNFLCDLLIMLHRFEAACNSVLRDVRDEGKGRSGKAPDWAANLFIRETANVYERAGGGKARAHNQETDGKSRPGGPFVRFLLEINGSLPSEVRFVDSALAYKANELLHPRANKNRGNKRRK